MLRCGAKTSLLSKNYYAAIHLAAYKVSTCLIAVFEVVTRRFFDQDEEVSYSFQHVRSIDSKLCCFSVQGDVNLVEAILDGHADPLLEGFTGVTALQIAAMCGHEQVCCCCHVIFFSPQAHCQQNSAHFGAK